MTLKSANGKEFETDFCIESPDTNRLYIHFVGKRLMEIIPVITDTETLPFDGYEKYVVVERIADSPDGSYVDLNQKEEQPEVEE